MDQASLTERASIEAEFQRTAVDRTVMLQAQLDRYLLCTSRFGRGYLPSGNPQADLGSPFRLCCCACVAALHQLASTLQRSLQENRFPPLRPLVEDLSAVTKRLVGAPAGGVTRPSHVHRGRSVPCRAAHSRPSVLHGDIAPNSCAANAICNLPVESVPVCWGRLRRAPACSPCHS
jgi:hypothetical protein